MTQARDIMEKNVITIDHNRTSFDAASLLKEKEISFLVITENEKPIGIVTERDIVKKLAAEDKVASKTPLREIMSNKFRWITPDTLIEDAIQKMLNNNIRRLIVLDNSSLAGVITPNQHDRIFTKQDTNQWDCQ